MRNEMTVLGVVVLGSTMACGGATVAGPSPVAEAPQAALAAARPLPAGIDPAYAHALATRRWDGGAFHHCLAPEVDRATLEPILAELTALTGVPRTEAGPCNVTWSADYGRHDHTYTELTGTPTVIVSARVFLYHDGAAEARHEAGHVLGLSHSPRPDDLMNASPRVDAFSHDELALLAWMYR